MKQIELKEFKIRSVKIKIKGISPLITHKFSEKAMRMMQDKQAGKSKTSKHEIKNPEADFEGAKHKSPLGFDGFPAAGFKAAMIRGAKMTGLVMKDVQGLFFIQADCPETQIVKIDYSECRMRTDMVRIGMGSADIRYRPEYLDWSADLLIEYNEGGISLDQIFQMLAAAGYGVGIGEMRPERGGRYTFGRFELVR